MSDLPKVDLDHSRLWLDLKAELERKAEGKPDKRQWIPDYVARAQLDHMLQMETLQR